MLLKKIILNNFKNHLSNSFEFRTHKIGIYGENGVGKTNILDAIYTAAVSKSFLNHQDIQLISTGQDFFRIECAIEGFELEPIKLVIKYKHRSKQIEWNDTKIIKMNEHFGKIPIVLCSPKDVELILGGSEDRRKWLDYSLSLAYKDYLTALVNYNLVLEQRNALLKQDEIHINHNLFEIYNFQMSKYSEVIYNFRKTFFVEIEPLIQNFYAILSNDKEKINLNYNSHLSSGCISTQLENSLSKDLILKRTSVGIHKDDITFFLNDLEMKKTGSQGQQKSLLYALKLAQAEWLYKVNNKKVLFLLDDFSDKLDKNRMKNLQKIINESYFVSQWFITDTSSQFFEEIENCFQIYLK